MKHRVIEALLRLYPAAWRREYGPELRGVLEDRPLGRWTVVNVVRGGVWQRLRSAEPWVVMGLPLAALVVVGLTWQIVAPPPYSVQMEQPGGPRGTLVTFLVFTLLFGGCGCWTVLRHGGTLPRAGVQAMKMGLLAGSPVLLMGLLMMTGALGVIVLGPGDGPTTFAEHGFAITFYGENGVVPFMYSPAGLVLGQFIDLAPKWMIGAIGGAIGRAIRHRPLPPIPVP